MVTSQPVNIDLEQLHTALQRARNTDLSQEERTMLSLAEWAVEWCLAQPHDNMTPRWRGDAQVALRRCIVKATEIIGGA